MDQIHAQPYSVNLVNWQNEADSLRSIRETVFMKEQNVPEELEWDEFDAISQHVLALDDCRQPIGAARLLPDGRIGRMAVLKEWRGKGVGRAMLKKLLQELIRQDATQAMLNAQTSVIGFYEKFGFRIEGEVFNEAGIPHIKMVLILK